MQHVAQHVAGLQRARRQRGCAAARAATHEEEEQQLQPYQEQQQVHLQIRNKKRITKKSTLGILLRSSLSLAKFRDALVTARQKTVSKKTKNLARSDEVDGRILSLVAR